MKYEAIFFDWDGVITDSVSVKTEAFSEMFKGYGPDVQEKVRSHHLQNGGMSRFDKFRIYYRDFLGVAIDEDKVQELADRFSTLVKDKVIKAAFVSGALETIATAYREGSKLFVVSGTPTGEMEEIVRGKGLRAYFEEVCGSPKTKSNWVRHLIGKYHLNSSNCLLFGDAMTDYLAAKENQVHFVGIRLPGCETSFPEDVIIQRDVHL